MKEIAIIGPTACGKSDLAVSLAKETNSYILSLDSLSIYKHIDIISAKPTKEEMSGIVHFGIDIIEPDEDFSAADFISLYKETKKRCKEAGKNLIIVGGSSFYLKSVIDGFSDEPIYSNDAINKTDKLLADIKKAYEFLKETDPKICSKIAPNDRYRIEKALLIYFHSGENMTSYRMKNKKISQKNDIKIFEIEIERELLRQRIFQRTENMLENGAIDEAAMLERRYTREPKAMGSIGIKEILEYFDGKIDKKELAELIATHTAQFAKRQSTFNRHQFECVVRKEKDAIKKEIYEYIMGKPYQ